MMSVPVTGLNIWYIFTKYVIDQIFQHWILGKSKQDKKTALVD